MSVQSQKPNPMFQSYATIEEALENANLLIKALPRESQLPAFTAVYCMMNTALKLLEEVKLEDTTPTLTIPQRQRPGDPGFPMQFTIKDLSPSEALQVLRNELAGFVCLAMDIHHKAPHVGDEVLTMVMLVAQLFSLPPETVEKEVKELKISRLLSQFFQKP